MRFARNTWASAAQPKQVRAPDSGKTPVKPAALTTPVLPALESCKYLSHQSSCKYLVPSSCKYLALSRTGKADREKRRQGDKETRKRQQLFLCVPSCLRVFVVRIPESAVPRSRRWAFAETTINRPTAHQNATRRRCGRHQYIDKRGRRRDSHTDPSPLHTSTSKDKTPACFTFTTGPDTTILAHARRSRNTAFGIVSATATASNDS